MKFNYIGNLNKVEGAYEFICNDLAPAHIIPRDWFEEFLSSDLNGYLQAVWFSETGYVHFQFGTSSDILINSTNTALKLKRRVLRNLCFSVINDNDIFVCRDLNKLDNNAQIGLWVLRRNDGDIVEFSLELNF